MQNLIRSFAIPLIFFGGSVFAAVPADEIKNLAASGAPALALKLLQQSEPKRDVDAAAWMQWQQQKIAIYQQQQDWDQVIRELEGLRTDDLPSDFMRWAQTQMGQAYLATDNGVDARLLLTQGIWANSDPSSQTLQTWRRMLIEAYLSEDRAGDAYTAMLRYRQDYPDDATIDWSLIQARVLLATDRAPEAVDLLETVEDRRAEVVLVLARHQRGEKFDAPLIESVSTRLSDLSLRPELRQQLLNALTSQAGMLEAGAQQIQLLEKIVAHSGNVEGIDGSMAAERLWRAYQDYGNQLANQLRLLVGDFEPWFDAIERMEQTSPVQARALLVVIANSDNKDNAQKAHLHFSHSLATQEREKPLLKPLYLGANRTTEVGELPEPVLYLLIDQALNSGDHAAAAKLMNLLQTPGSTQTVDWRLRRSRSQILAGVIPVGADMAKELARSGVSLEREQFEYLIRIGFDLQQAGNLEGAYQLFALLLNKAPELNLRRELLFWMADIRFAAKKYEEAARLYFQAASVISAENNDIWQLMARQQAAQSLVKAGYFNDARQVYEYLLQNVTDPERQAVLQRELQQLKLLARNKQE